MEAQGNHKESEGVERSGRSTLRALWALTMREVKKWLKDPLIMLITIVQPLLWMALLGKTMNIGALLSSLPPQVREQMMVGAFGTSDYFSYMAVGMISFTVIFTAMFTGMSVVWDRRLGFLNKVLSTPIPRSVIVFAKVLNSTIRSMFQATLVLLAALALGLKLGPGFTPINVLGLYAVIFLFGSGLSFLFLSFTLRSTKIETPMAVVNLVNLPLIFTSNIFFPTSLMPSWLRPVAEVNPVSYLTDAIRQLTIFRMDVGALLLDLAYLGALAAVLSAIGIVLARRYLSG